MRMNTLKPAKGSKKQACRLGRGIGSGLGKTSGRGHKGQHSRAGGFHKVGFEGGQMPLQRRLPKFGFSSRKAKVTEEVLLSELNQISESVIDLDILKKFDFIARNTQFVKVILAGEIKKAITLKGIRVSQGAKNAVLAAGGKVE